MKTQEKVGLCGKGYREMGLQGVGHLGAEKIWSIATDKRIYIQ